MTTPRYTGKLKDTAVLVIGGTSGLGFGVAEALLEHEVSHLFISSSRQSKIDATVARLRETYLQSKDTTTIVGLACDLGDETTLEENVQTLFSQLAAHGRKLDHIVYTAGDALAPRPIETETLSSMKQSGMVRFFGPFFVAKHARPHLNAGPASSITFTTGAGGERPRPNWAVLASYLSGLHGMTRGLALDLRPVRVNLISPGAVETELWETSFGGSGREVVEKALAESAKKAATGKVGSVQDVVESYLYVMKDRNVTGTVIRSDSGSLLM